MASHCKQKVGTGRYDTKVAGLYFKGNNLFYFFLWKRYKEENILM